MRDFPVVIAVIFLFNIEGVGALIVRNTTAIWALLLVLVIKLRLWLTLCCG